MGQMALTPSPENATMEDLLQLVQKSSTETQKRASAIWMLLLSTTREKVYDLLHIPDRSLGKWIKFFNTAGADGLLVSGRSGTPKKIPQELGKALCSDITNPQHVNRAFWTVRAFHGYLQESYTVECSYSTVLRFFNYL